MTLVGTVSPVYGTVFRDKFKLAHLPQNLKELANALREKRPVIVKYSLNNLVNILIFLILIIFILLISPWIW